jgi:hypothetical protein
MHGPFELDLKVRLTDGERSAVVTYTMPVGQYPTQEKIQEAMKAALEKAQEEVGPDWRLQNRHEFENEVISDRYGGVVPEFATKHDWDTVEPA